MLPFPDPSYLLFLVAGMIALVLWCIAAWSHFRMDREIQPWVDRHAMEKMRGRRIDRIVEDQPELLTEVGRRHLKRLQISRLAFYAFLAVATLIPSCISAIITHQ